MFLKYLIIGAVCIVLVPPGLLVAYEGQWAAYEAQWAAYEEEAAQEEEGPFQEEEELAGEIDFTRVYADGSGDYGDPMFLSPAPLYYGDTAVRFGWWAVATSGNLNKVGEYQSVRSSPFFDIDRLFSDCCQTTNLTLSGTDDETTQVGIDMWRPGLDTQIDYQRFIHRRDHDPLDVMDQSGSGENIGQLTDLNVGDDYAIRVQELDARFKGHITENIKWGLNVWGMHKKGERQVMAMDHACGAQCHIQTEGQKIDWLTMEIEPVIEARFGRFTAEYSRTMRSFNQSDSAATRMYSSFPSIIDNSVPYGYAVVPQNFTQIDRLKIGGDLTENTRFYANLFLGDTKNRNRNVHRDFNGWDLRVTNRTVDNLSLTGFAKWYEEKGQLPDTFPEDSLYDAGVRPSDEVRAPVDRERIKAGLKGRYKLSEGYRSSGLALTGGYEYSTIDRSNVTYFLNAPMGSPNAIGGISEFRQPTTITHMMHVGTDHRWSACMDTFIRYKMYNTTNPLLGFSESQEGSVFGDAINTNRPQHTDLIEFGGTWSPTYSFLLNASIGLQKRHTDISPQFADFDEEDYPIVLSAWYAPTKRWSLSGGLAFLSNDINQEITIGKANSPETAEHTLFNYNGRSTVATLGTRYAWTERLTLTGDIEWVESFNGFDEPLPPGGQDFQFLPGASDVLTETTRLSAGVDYWLRDGITCYFVYNYYNWDDKAGNNETGRISYFLTGLTATF